MGCFMSNLEIRRLDLSDAEAFMDYIHNWSTDTSPFKIDAEKLMPRLIWIILRNMWKKFGKRK